MELYPFQKKAVDALLGGKHICIASVGTGKGSIALHWAKAQGKNNVLFVTTASKRDARDAEKEADAWFPSWRESLSSFSCISWQGLAKWYANNRKDIDDFAFIFDEVACCKAGISSLRGTAFLKITKQTDCWAGFTATPGDCWLDYYAYFTACGKVRNKTDFKYRFCNIQTFKGFPEIVGYRETETLEKWWREIADIVDSSEADRQLPSEYHKVINFEKPKGYDKVIKTHYNLDGELIETTGGMCAYLRQLCVTPAKLTWIKEFVENLGDRAVIFYNFIEEGDKLAETIEKALPKGARIWRIDGRHHEIPTAETCGPRDIVLTQWQSGSMGLNLQFMSYWVSCSPNYSWSISEQGRGRIRRIGQKHHMDFFYLVCNNAIEGDIYKVLKEKGTFNQELWAQEKGI